MRRILIATDGSPHALRAAAFAARLARELREADVTLITVGHIPTVALVGPGAGAVVEYAAIDEALETSGKEILNTTRLEFAGVDVPVTSMYRRGDPAHEIIAAAQEMKMDLIIMGNRGRGPLGGLILGSVSERVLHGSRIPVLIVH